MKINDSARLQFELMSEQDACLMFQLDQDPEVMRYINGGKVTTVKEIHAIYIPRMKQYTNAANGWGIWKVIVKEKSDYIGWILVRPMDFFNDHFDCNNLEIGWRLMRRVWGNGYATEAAKTVMQAIEANGICDRFTAVAMEDNQASINVMKKLGMRYVKTDVYSGPLGDSRCVFYQREVRGIEG